ncbi:MAG: PEP-CTERM sorting domain-containing protein [Proteobacteria bacterium]|nr:PEP-CTERM sorting domain-containing protein [Pseudomonadota bacterium]
MKKILAVLMMGLLILGVAGMADAALLGYVDSPSTNSTDWATAVTNSGGVINANVNFNSLSTGVLNGNFYQGTDGVTLTASGAFNGVAFGEGPAQGNVYSPILNSGEGLHSASNYLNGGSGEWQLTVSFDSVVSGFGLNTIDYFGASGGQESLTIEAFTGAGGTGTSLGSFSSFNQNYQMNHIYFMGLISDSNDIMSVVFTDFNGGTGDVIGVDDIVFATSSSSSPAPVPEPATMLLLGFGLVAIAGFRKRLQK